jgi:late competence protein required for DNA uptake (superfamily II DNA/RNA helicase)
MTVVDRDLACEQCGAFGAAGEWIEHSWVCARCLLLGRLEAEQALPVSTAHDDHRHYEFRRLLGLLAEAMGVGR